MKRVFLYFFLISIATLTIISCKSETKTTEETKTVSIPVEKYEVLIDGMTCTGCEQTIQTAVNGLDGIEKVTASHIKGDAIVEVQKGKFDSLAIKSKISEAGYTVTGFKTMNE
jgi:copper chaperone CopZ